MGENQDADSDSDGALSIAKSADSSDEEMDQLLPPRDQPLQPKVLQPPASPHEGNSPAEPAPHPSHAELPNHAIDSAPGGLKRAASAIDLGLSSQQLIAQNPYSKADPSALKWMPSPVKQVDDSLPADPDPSMPSYKEMLRKQKQELKIEIAVKTPEHDEPGGPA